MGDDVFVDLGFRADGGGVGDDSEELFKILSPSKIWMSKSAREWASHYGMSDAEFGKYLMQRERMRASGMIGGEQGEDWQPQADHSTGDDEFYQTSYEGRLPDTQPTTEVEDRREENPYFPDLPEQIRSMAYTPAYTGYTNPQQTLDFFGRDQPSPLGNQLGYGSIGRAPLQQRNFSFLAQNPPPPGYIQNPAAYLGRLTDYQRLLNEAGYYLNQ